MLIMFSKIFSLFFSFDKNSLDLIPGLPPIDSMHMPESSAKHAILNFKNPNKDLILAFSLNVLPVSSGDKILSN